MSDELRLSANEPDVRSHIEIKRSQFITILRRVNSPAAARELVADARSEFPDARHHCNAFVISVPHAQPLRHSSDDGEPSGTAGRPMLDVLVGANVTDVAAVVVRYFGGTLLGTGGLVRAYSESVRTALESTSFVRQDVFRRLRVSLAHSVAGRTEAELRAKGYAVVGATYRETHTELDFAVSDPERFATDLAAATSGAIFATDVGDIIREVPANLV